MLSFNKIVILLCFALTCTACGFHPLYGDQSMVNTQEGSGSVASALNEVDIKPLKERLGQRFYNILLDDITPLGQPKNPLYTLKGTLTRTQEDLGVQQNASTVRKRLTIHAYMTLTSKSGKVYSFTVVGRSGINTSVSAYAIFESEQAAEERILIQLAQDVKTRVALLLQRK